APSSDRSGARRTICRHLSKARSRNGAPRSRPPVSLRSDRDRRFPSPLMAVRNTDLDPAAGVIGLALQGTAELPRPELHQPGAGAFADVVVATDAVILHD